MCMRISTTLLTARTARWQSLPQCEMASHFIDVFHLVTRSPFCHVIPRASFQEHKLIVKTVREFHLGTVIKQNVTATIRVVKLIGQFASRLENHQYDADLPPLSQKRNHVARSQSHHRMGTHRVKGRYNMFDHTIYLSLLGLIRLHSPHPPHSEMAHKGSDTVKTRTNSPFRFIVPPIASFKEDELLCEYFASPWYTFSHPSVGKPGGGPSRPH